MIEDMKRFTVIDPQSGREIKLAMQDLYLTGTVIDVGAKLVVRHVFRSGEKNPVEAVYSFMLPRDAALKRFKIVGEGFNVESRLMKTEEALETYEAGLEAGKLSSVTQQYRDGVVNLSVGNIRPNETVVVYLELYTGVEVLDDGLRFRFPFTLAPGYHPMGRPSSDGVTGEILLPESEFGDVLLPEWRQDVDQLHNIGFNLEIDSEAPITSIGSPSHPVKFDVNGKQGIVELAVRSDTPDRDLILDVKTKTEPRVISAKGPGGDGVFAVVIPSNSFGDGDVEARRIVFLVDRSGSMQGKQMSEAKRALLACLGALSEDDRFGLVVFDNRVESFSKRLVSGSMNNREKVTVFLDGVDARGGTELVLGLKEAYSLLGKSGGDVVLFTDGQVMGSEDILAEVERDNIRVHCLGIGSASQDRFLSLLTRRSGGLSRFMSPRERVDLAGLGLFSGIKSPVAQDIRVELVDLEGSLQPAPGQVVYSNSPFVVWGMVDKAKPGALCLSWGDEEVQVPLVFSEEGYEFVKQIHGSRLLTDLDSQYSPGMNSRRSRRIRRRIEALSLEYGLSSRFYSLVAVVSRKDDLVGPIPQTIVVPVGMPRDTEFKSYFAVQNKSIPSLKKNDGIYRNAVEIRVMERARPSEIYQLQTRSWDIVDSIKSGFDAFDLAAKIEPDGGMPGDTTITRILYTMLTLLYLYSQPCEVRRAFQKHIQKLEKYLQQLPDDLTQPQKTTVKTILTKIEQGETIDGNWYHLLEQFYGEEEIESKEIWRELTLAAK